MFLGFVIGLFVGVILMAIATMGSISDYEHDKEVAIEYIKNNEKLDKNTLITILEERK